ncbi:MAG: peptidase MA family metallohydrolase [Deltaproteobacteria bacterium]
MRYFFLSLFLFFCMSAGAGAQEDAAWQEMKGDHFIVSYVGDAVFAREVLRKAEYYYGRVARDLGYTRYDNYWQWERRAKVRIFPTQASYVQATGQPSWSIGSAYYATREILSYSGCQAFVEETLPHEIAHLIFREFVGFASDVPLWLDEGVAQRQEPSKQRVVDYYVWQIAQAGKLWPLRRLTQARQAELEDPDQARTFYIEAASVVSFLIERNGADAFIEFCRQLRDGKPLDTALRFAYPSKIRSLDELEQAWLGYVNGLRFPQEQAQRRSDRPRVLVALPQ